MTKIIRALVALASIVSAIPSAQAATNWTSTNDLKGAAGTIIGILLIVAFVSCLILWLVGSLTKENNPAQSKWCFQAVWMVGIGLPVISLLFYLFIGADAVVTPKF
jgi:hypothetical protein